jgi:DNA mismatch repair protein MutS2
VISGPNTGGKTVALKTVGLLALMAQSGLHVPAAPGSRLPVFRRIYADIGDDQSIASSLSTFSAHLATLVEMTRDLDLPALVLLDEVGAGTDPTEGGALGVAIVDHFRERGALVVATTHHGLMKAYAQATEGIACASFGYDPATYEPTFRLSMGVPGRSLALEMAERLGLPAEVVAGARSRVSDREAQAEALMKRLEEDRAALRREAEVLEESRRALEDERAAQAAAGRAVEEKRRALAESFARDLKRRSLEAAEKARAAIEEAVRRIETSRRSAAAEGARARSDALLAIRRAEEAVLADPALGLDAEPEPAAAELRVGSRVKVRSLGVIGEVVDLRERARPELAVGGKRMRVPRSELAVLSVPSAQASTGRAVTAIQGLGPRRHGGEGRPRGSGTAEVIVIGMTVDEALPVVDKFLDDSALAERKEVRVVHGFGEGRLRKAVAGLLEGHPHVAAFRPGQGHEGGAGATVVELKD